MKKIKLPRDMRPELPPQATGYKFKQDKSTTRAVLERMHKLNVIDCIRPGICLLHPEAK